MGFLDFILISLILIFLYYFIKILFKIDKKLKEKKLKETYLINDKNIKHSLGIELNIIHGNFEYEHLGKSYLKKIIEDSKEDFEKFKNRIKKNIEKGKIVKTNKKHLITFIERTIKNKNKSIALILEKLKKDKILTLEELGIISVESEASIENQCKETVDNLFKYGALELYNINLISKEEFEKRKKFFYCDQ